MWAGTSALKKIDQSLVSIRNDAVRLDSQLGQLTNKIAASHRHRAKILNDIAQIRLAEIESGELNANFTTIDREAADLLSQREQALERLNSDIGDIDDRINQAEKQRNQLLVTVNQSAEQIVELEAQVQQELKGTQVYIDQFQKAQRAESIAEEAMQKMQLAQANMAEKAEPYQADELFMYLWERKYGTSDYQAGLLTRFVDGWLARLIRYQAARVNYWNLVEIPKRLLEHSERVGDEADEQHSVLQSIEIEALDKAGVKDMNTELEALRSQLDSQDDSIESLEAQLIEYIEQRARYLAGEDDYIVACLRKIAGSLEHQNLQAIHRYVRATASPTDDHLVLELQGIEDSLNDVNDDLADVRKLHEVKLSKLRELEKVRRNFKNSRFDDTRSGFGNQALIISVLSEFLQGGVSGTDVWKVIKRNQRYRQLTSVPDFGSGGLGEIADAIGGEIMRQGRRRRRSPRGSTWQWPKSRGGGGDFRMPRGGGGGGFKTGGGF